MQKFLSSPENLWVLEKVNPEGFDLGGVVVETENLWRQICETNWFGSSALHCTIGPNREASGKSSSGWGSLSHLLFLLRKCKAWRKQIGGMEIQTPFYRQVQKLHFHFRSKSLASSVLKSPSLEHVSHSLSLPPLSESGAFWAQTWVPGEEKSQALPRAREHPGWKGHLEWTGMLVPRTQSKGLPEIRLNPHFPASSDSGTFPGSPFRPRAASRPHPRLPFPPRDGHFIGRAFYSLVKPAKAQETESQGGRGGDRGGAGSASPLPPSTTPPPPPT